MKLTVNGKELTIEKPSNPKDRRGMAHTDPTD